MNLEKIQYKTCCFIGHRKIEITEELKREICNYVEYLISHENVKVFLIGSRSEFNSLCHGIVTDLKEKYPEIKRIGYTCRSEGAILESERAEWEKKFFNLEKKEIRLLGVEEEYEHKTKYKSGKASYVERNRAMIDDSDFCLFYYDENYAPPQRKRGIRGDGFYSPRSGTAVAYVYAKRKKKTIRNFFKR